MCSFYVKVGNYVCYAYICFWKRGIQCSWSQMFLLCFLSASNNHLKCLCGAHVLWQSDTFQLQGAIFVSKWIVKGAKHGLIFCNLHLEAAVCTIRCLNLKSWLDKKWSPFLHRFWLLNQFYTILIFLLELQYSKKNEQQHTRRESQLFILEADKHGFTNIYKEREGDCCCIAWLSWLCY